MLNDNEKILPINIALVDDHQMFREGIAKILNDSKEYNVMFDVGCGEGFLNMIKEKGLPDIAIIDVQMKGMSGFELVKKLKSKYSEIKVLALSIFEDEISIVRMLKNGAKGYLTKGSDLAELKKGR